MTRFTRQDERPAHDRADVGRRDGEATADGGVAAVEDIGRRRGQSDCEERAEDGREVDADDSQDRREPVLLDVIRERRRYQERQRHRSRRDAP
jgi:hypothetical protein